MAKLLARHERDYPSLFRRFSLDVGTTAPDLLAKTTPVRLEVYVKNTTADPDLEALFCQFGRYLLISCSRPGSLPANLQGVWNDSNEPAWAGDYHSNINVEMNYWPAEPANLAECHRPFIDYVTSILGVYPNLFDSHPPFQIDGNFGATSGYCEMLVQSHAGRIHLLPGLPKAWPTGKVAGLCTRGGFEVEMSWEGGRLIQAVIHSKSGLPCKVVCGDKSWEFNPTAGESDPLTLASAVEPRNVRQMGDMGKNLPRAFRPRGETTNRS